MIDGGWRRIVGRLGLAPWAVLWVAACLSGCSAGPRDLGDREDLAPPDFALVVTVTPLRTPPGNPPHLRAAQHVVEADGTFRAAVGPGTHAELLPPVTARLDPTELDRLWRLVEPLQVALADAPAAKSRSRVRVALAMTAWQRTRRGEVPSDQVEPLLRRLAELRGDAGPGPGEPWDAALQPDVKPAEP